MKSKDIVPLLMVVVISSIVALIASSIFVPDPPDSRTINNVQEINAEFPKFDDEVFHSDIIDTFTDINLKEQLQGN